MGPWETMRYYNRSLGHFCNRGALGTRGEGKFGEVQVGGAGQDETFSDLELQSELWFGVGHLLVSRVLCSFGRWALFRRGPIMNTLCRATLSVSLSLASRTRVIIM